MKHDPHTLINVQALSEPQRAKHRRKVYSCYKAGIDKTPDQLKSDFAPWSSKAIREYVRRAYGMSISRRTARRYMQKMGFTCQCPVKAARERNPAPVRKWPETDYPAIRKEAAESGSAIDWADESPVPACETKARGHSPVGVSPVLCGKEAPSDGKSPESGRRGALEVVLGAHRSSAVVLYGVSGR
ncbi:MAG: winged helix-turn-helix domain-containing protein [Kiritimatiellae bacterium]|nr:winged helix-turn-helix domain-containing protein [Kiritimatiellia bacterium]